MKLSKIILTSSLVLSSLFAAAQDKEVTAFNPHWYVQGQFGVQETLGETSFGKLLSPTGQLAVGYNFSSKFGARFALNAWQSKAAFELTDAVYKWKWNYVAPTIDITADLTNIIGGYKPNRLVSVGVFAGIGANFGFSNDEAATAKAALAQRGHDALRLYWDGTKTRFLGQMGATVDFKVSNRVKLGIELQANVLPDGYNSKKAGNADWYFNALAGVKIALGKTSKKVAAPAPLVMHDTVYVDRVVEKVVEKIVEKPVEVKTDAVEVQKLRRDIFFTIAKTVVTQKEMSKVEEVANFMKANPASKVVVTGYADKGTGSKALNLRLSKNRANAVVKVLTDKYKIATDRIIVKSMDDDMEQPYSDPVQNRVAICVVE